MLKLSAIALATAATVIAGCGKQNLYVAHDTVIGVNAAVNAERSAGTLVIGYDRDFLTLIPVSVEPEEGIGAAVEGAKEAMSAISCSNLKVSGLFLTEFGERLATGRAARLYAKQLAASNKTVFSCLNAPADGGTTATQTDPPQGGQS